MAYWPIGLLAKNTCERFAITLTPKHSIINTANVIIYDDGKLVIIVRTILRFAGKCLTKKCEESVVIQSTADSCTLFCSPSRTAVLSVLSASTHLKNNIHINNTIS